MKRGITTYWIVIGMYSEEWSANGEQRFGGRRIAIVSALCGITPTSTLHFTAIPLVWNGAEEKFRECTDQIHECIEYSSLSLGRFLDSSSTLRRACTSVS